jgi:2-amino-4-hydroxy-6-hydroxymethyldihydropteridine diphosphokinase
MICYLSLGANLGDRAGQLSRAVALLAAHEQINVRQVSPVYETRAVADEPQPDYLNLAVAVETDLEPAELLAVAHDIEDQLGRTRPYRNAPRTMDIDLLLCGAIMSGHEAVTLPHPEMLGRQFVLQPLSDLNPQLKVGDSPPIGELVDASDPDVRRVGELAEIVTGA